MFVFSPSNISVYLQCPRKFQAQSITKELKWTPSAQKTRGTMIHEHLETVIGGMSDRGFTPDALKTREALALIPDLRTTYVYERLDSVKGLPALIEHELAVNQSWHKTGWWDDDAYLRAKADCIVDAEGRLPRVIDFKTGKVYDKAGMQLRIEAFLVHLIYGASKVAWEYWYVDQGQTVGEVIDFSMGYTGMHDVIEAMRSMHESINADSYPVKKNRFCRWCGLYGTCGV